MPNIGYLVVRLASLTFSAKSNQPLSCDDFTLNFQLLRLNDLMSLRRMLIVHLLLQTLAMLKFLGCLELRLRLPSWSTKAFDAVGVLKHGSHFLKLLSGGLWEEEEDVDGHGHAKDREHQICLPLDIDKGRRHEVAEREVESPNSR